MVPRFGNLERLTENGHRFLAADTGLWLEVHRPWVHIIWPMALQFSVAMPYGTLEPSIQFAFDSLPLEMLTKFREDARKTLPNESAAWITWNDQTREFAYRPLAATSAGAAHLKLDRPALNDNEHLVIDIHSHARIPAFFSPEDNEDDDGEVKLSVVVGQLGSDQQSNTKLRLCANGLSISSAEMRAVTEFRFNGDTIQ